GEVRFAFTVIGPVPRPSAHVETSSASPAMLKATPIPFEHALTLLAPGAGTLELIDASGRLVRTLATTGGGVTWDGRDAHGLESPAGVYWVRFHGTGGSVTRHVVKLGR